MKPILSIIIPVYNVAAYLSRCVESVFLQSFQNWEMILVDDGSTDQCPSICDELAGKDTRIKVIHKTNGGLSSARNAGIDIAEGKYFTFIDSDDKLVDTQSLENAINILDNDKAIDIVQFQYNRFTVDNPIVERPELTPYCLYDKHDFIEHLDTCTGDWKNSIFSGAWAKVYRRHLFDYIRYPLGVLWEDIIVLLQLFDIINGIAVTDCGLYGFYYREDSISHSVPKPAPMTDKVNSIIAVYKYLSLNSGNERIKQFVYLNLLFMMASLKKKLGDTWDISEQVSFMQSNIPSMRVGSWKNRIKLLMLRLVGVKRWLYYRSNTFSDEK